MIEDVSGPGRARAGHVIVRPEAVGICGSDFHLFSGDVGALSGARDFYPRIQGHEVSAVVQDAGDSQDVTKGERVAIWPVLPCGLCYPCRNNRPNVCVRFRLVGVHLDGGLAERLEVPAGLVFGVGDLDPDSASFVEPASVAVHALARGRITAGEQVIVFGAGPIGLATLVAAKSKGANVLSVDPQASRRDLAKRLGAEEVHAGPRRDRPGRGQPRVHSKCVLASFPAGPRGRGVRIRDDQVAGCDQDRGDRALTEQLLTAPRPAFRS